jgi:RNA polymerase sigma-70 factor (ECF subfamily)
MVWMEENDLELVDQARAGNQDAFREIVVRHSDRIFKVAYRLTGSEVHADDVVQETFLRAYRSLHRFDARSQLGTWLYRIAVNCSMDLMRKESRRNARETSEERVELAALAAPEPRPDRLAASGEIGAMVAEVLRELSPTERAAFVLRHFEGYSSVEIGKLLGMRPGATRNAVFRAVRKLRLGLGPMLGIGQEGES